MCEAFHCVTYLLTYLLTSTYNDRDLVKFTVYLTKPPDFYEI